MYHLALRIITYHPVTKADTTETSEDPLESLLSQLDSGGNEGGEDNEELQNILETMMRQLMSKEILYEPLKELHEKVLPLSTLQIH